MITALAWVSGSSSPGAAFPLRDHLPDRLAPEGALPVRRELDAEAFVKQALGVLAARSLVRRHTHTQGIHECPVAAIQKMIICLYRFVTRECGSAALLTRAAAIVAKGKRVRMRAVCAASAGHVRWLRLANARCERSA